MECSLHMVPAAAQSESNLACIRIDGKGFMLRKRGRDNREWDGKKKDLCVALHGSSPDCNAFLWFWARLRDGLRQPKGDGRYLVVGQVFMSGHIGSGNTKFDN